MAATKDDIRRWLEAGLEKSPMMSHVLVVCDTYDHEDYPVYLEAATPERARESFAAYNGPNMQRVMEVYNYSLPLDDQLNEHRAMHFDGAPT